VVRESIGSVTEVPEVKDVMGVKEVAAYLTSIASMAPHQCDGILLPTQSLRAYAAAMAPSDHRSMSSALRRAGRCPAAKR